MVWLFLAKAAELNLEVTKAPEVLDLEKVKSWVNGSVWCLLVLNIASLLFYLGALLYPTLQQSLARTSNWLKARREKQISIGQTHSHAEIPKTPAVVNGNPSAANIQSAENATKVTEPTGSGPNISEAQLSTPANPAATPAAEASASQITESEVASVLDIPTEVTQTFDIPAPPEPIAEPIAEPIPEPAPAASETEPAPQVTESAPVENPAPNPTPAFASEVTEVLEIPQEPLPEPANFDEKEMKMGEPATEQLQTDAAATASESLDASPSPELPSLDAALLSDSQLAESTATEEISIFDPAVIDQALQEEPTPEEPKP